MQKERFKYIERLTEKNLKHGFKSGKIIIILGARQVGKTTLIQHVLKSKKTTFFNFDIEIDKTRFKALSVVAPGDVLKTLNNPDFIVIDEVQRLPEAGRIVKGWYDSDFRAQIILLGSSSFQISDQTAESLAGRNQKVILSSLTFWEIVRSQAWAKGFSPDQLFSGFKNLIDPLLMNCMAFGHYPEVIVGNDKRSYLLNLTSDVLWKDFLYLGLVKTPDLIQKLLILLAHQVGSEVSVNELSIATGLARPTVERYIALLEQAFIIFRLPAFSTNPRKEISKSHKVYFWDTGIRNALLNLFSTNPLRPDIGALWENWVVAEFARQNLLVDQVKKMFFWRSKAGSEIDMVLQQDEQLQAYEVKWSPRKRVRRAFTNQYGIQVQVIHKNSNLFFNLDLEDKYSTPKIPKKKI